MLAQSVEPEIMAATLSLGDNGELGVAVYGFMMRYSTTDGITRIWTQDLSKSVIKVDISHIAGKGEERVITYAVMDENNSSYWELFWEEKVSGEETYYMAYLYPDGSVDIWDDY